MFSLSWACAATATNRRVKAIRIVRMSSSLSTGWIPQYQPMFVILGNQWRGRGRSALRHDEVRPDESLLVRLLDVHERLDDVAARRKRERLVVLHATLLQRRTDLRDVEDNAVHERVAHLPGGVER